MRNNNGFVWALFCPHFGFGFFFFFFPYWFKPGKLTEHAAFFPCVLVSWLVSELAIKLEPAGLKV